MFINNIKRKSDRKNRNFILRFFFFFFIFDHPGKNLDKFMVNCSSLWSNKVQN